MVRFNITFTVLAPIYPIGVGIDESMSKTSIMKKFAELLEEYPEIEVAEGYPVFDEPALITNTDGNRRISIGKMKVKCKCTLEAFKRFYEEETKKGQNSKQESITENPFYVELKFKSGLFS